MVDGESWEDELDREFGPGWRERARLYRQAEEAGVVEPFYEAAKAGDAGRVRRMLAEWPILAHHSWEEMGTAVQSGSVGVVSALLEVGVSPRGCDDFGFSPLMMAASAGHLEICRLLVEAGAEVNATQQDRPVYELGRSALDFAVQGGHRAVADYLAPLTDPGLRIRADFAAPDRPSAATLVLARAASSGNLDGTRAALKAGADVDGRTGDTRLTALHAAAERDDARLVALLLDAGARIDARDQYGETALWKAVRAGHPAMVRLLCVAGADVDARDFWDEQTPLIQAAIEGRPGVVAELLAAGADREAVDRHGQAAADYALFTPSPEARAVLIRHRDGDEVGS